jgi:Cu2+-exporting ATPase
VGERAFHARALSELAASPLLRILAPSRRSSAPSKQAEWLARFSRIFVVGALALGAVTFFAWSFVDVQRGWWAAVSVLIVACPCAIGLGTPLAREMALRRLRRAGLFVRNDEALDKLAEVTSVVFDKTGTLTELAADAGVERAISAIPPVERAVLAAMVRHSRHPASRAIADVLVSTPAAPCVVTETAGVGLSAELDGCVYSLRAAPERPGAIVFERSAPVRAVIATLQLEETLRPHAAEDVRALADDGLRVAVLSGDRQARVDRVAGAIGLEPARCRGELSPEGKAAWLRQHTDERALVLGDGVNDVPAFAAAFASGTPAIDRPFVPAKADFYYRARGLSPIKEALSVSRKNAQAARFNYAFAAAYNAIVLSVAAAGAMSPLVAAVAMPTSSLVIVLINALIMRRA